MPSTRFEIEEAPVVRMLLTLQGIANPRLTDPNAGNAPECGADVVWETERGRVAYQVTVYHGDPKARGGSLMRQQESRLSRSGRPYTMAGITNPLPGLVASILAKADLSAKYDFAGFSSANLVVAAGLSMRWGAQASTFLLEEFLNLDALQGLTAPALSGSRFSRAYVVVMLSARGHSSLFEWNRTTAWRQVGT